MKNRKLETEVSVVEQTAAITPICQTAYPDIRLASYCQQVQVTSRLNRAVELDLS